jgi:hypothetical protein
MRVEQQAQRKASKSSARTTDSLGSAINSPPSDRICCHGFARGGAPASVEGVSLATILPRRVIDTDLPESSTRRITSKHEFLNFVTEMAI